MSSPLPDSLLQPSSRPFSERQIDLAVFCALAVVVAALYGHTLAVPWYFDDYQILETPALHSIRTAWPRLFANRGVANLTLAINYQFGAENPWGYHLVNSSIHVASGWVVYLLLKRIFVHQPLWAFLGALLFVTHPLQTQAVTYVIQRMASLSGFFLFLTVYLFARAREVSSVAGHSSRRYWGYYGGALFAGTFALYSKENAALLPFLLFLFDRFFLPDPAVPRRRRLLEIAPFLVFPLLFGLQHLLMPLSRGVDLSTLASPSRATTVSPLIYLFTEFKVLWLYLRLLVLPVGQMLDYNYPLVTTLHDGRSLLALAGLLALAVLAWQQRRRRPTLSFGVAWFFVALAIESSVIPLDAVFEHRLYVPFFGVVVLVTGLARELPWRRVALGGFAVILLLLAVLTWQRNLLWSDPTRFFEDNLAKAPQSVRMRLNLAGKYREAERYAEAQRLLEATVRDDPDYAKGYKALANHYIEWGEWPRAVELLDAGLRRLPGNEMLAQEAAQLRLLMKEPEAALGYLQVGLASHPQCDYLYNALGQTYEALGRITEAEGAYRRSLELLPVNPVAQGNLAKNLYRQGRMSEALREFLHVLAVEPRNSTALQGGYLSARRSGDTAMAEWTAKRLQEVDPAAWERLAEPMERR